MTDSRAASAASAPTGSTRTGSTRTTERSPWPALWALVIGFFMILVDTTIVSVANPAIKAALDPNTNNLDNVVWVTSAYLLTYAVPLLITGRLGDRFGRRTSTSRASRSSPSPRSPAVWPPRSRCSSPLAPCRAWAPPS